MVQGSYICAFNSPEGGTQNVEKEDTSRNGYGDDLRSGA
jgi:hypothetical protein